jgi:hypothetical protein
MAGKSTGERDRSGLVWLAKRIDEMGLQDADRDRRMVDRNMINDPEHWRSRAEEMLILAEHMREAETKRMMLRIADDYEKLA